VNSWKVILATIVIFGAGVITGGLLVDHVTHPWSFHRPFTPRPPEQPAMPPQLRPDFLNKQFVQQLNDQLHLTKEQREKIQKIIGEGQQSTHDLWKLVGPQFQLVWRDTRLQIREVLTPEQRKEFEMLMRQQHPMRHPPATNAPPEAPAPTATNGPATNGPVI
jgi:hypothetical protein